MRKINHKQRALADWIEDMTDIKYPRDNVLGLCNYINKNKPLTIETAYMQLLQDNKNFVLALEKIGRN